MIHGSDCGCPNCEEYGATRSYDRPPMPIDDAMERARKVYYEARQAYLDRAHVAYCNEPVPAAFQLAGILADTKGPSEYAANIIAQALTEARDAALEEAAGIADQYAFSGEIAAEIRRAKSKPGV